MLGNFFHQFFNNFSALLLCTIIVLTSSIWMIFFQIFRCIAKYWNSYWIKLLVGNVRAILLWFFYCVLVRVGKKNGMSSCFRFPVSLSGLQNIRLKGTRLSPRMSTLEKNSLCFYFLKTFSGFSRIFKNNF